MREEILKLLGAYLVLMSIGYVYNKYKKTIDVKEQYDDSQLIHKYLLNESTLTKSKKPILWVHIEFNKNARNWDSHGSRMNDGLNQPYQYLTIRSIIEKCGDSFNVCLIDDEAFSKIIPEWNTDVYALPDPLRTHVRHLAMAKVLHIYGGFLVPSSFICFHNLRSLYDSHLENASSVLIGEFQARSSVTSQTQYFPNPRLIACKKGNNLMKEYATYLEQLISKDATSEFDFMGEPGRWWYQAHITNQPVAIIPAEELGNKSLDNRPILLENLISDTDVKLSNTAIGVYVPDAEILKRTTYQWFARLSPTQVLQSNTLIGKYLLTTF